MIINESHGLVITYYGGWGGGGGRRGIGGIWMSHNKIYLISPPPPPIPAVPSENHVVPKEGPNKQKYSNQRREKMKTTSKEVIIYVVQLLNWLVIGITIIER